jgi:hypothetical protein
MNDALAASNTSFAIYDEEPGAVDNEKVFDELGMKMLPSERSWIVVDQTEL